METVNNENKLRQKRKLLLLAPLMVFPLLGIAFWAMGGGSQQAADEKKEKTSLKIEMPNANLIDRPMDKLSYYNKANQDSLKRLEYMRNDPYYTERAAQGNPVGQEGLQFMGTGSNDATAFRSGTTGYNDPNEAKVYERLNSLQAILNTPSSPIPAPTTGPSSVKNLDRAEIDRLESLLAMSKENKSEPDPELRELHGMLDKVLDIQYPERVMDRFKKKSEEQKGRIFSVSTTSNATPISLLEKETGQKHQTAFYALDEIEHGEEEESNTIMAVMHETQTLVSGSIAKLRLATDIYINGILIPKDHFVFGIANLNGERLSVAIDNIRYKEHIFPVRLAVFGLDGIDGIHIPGAIGRDAAKQSGGSAISGMNVTTIDPSIGAQAANAGIELTKNLVGRKIKLVKVTVKAGYQVVLKDLNEKN